MPRLTSISGVATGVAIPAYNPLNLAPGIVHIGLGAFHRAHQAVYTDDALAAEGGDWRIIGVNLRSTQIVDELERQNGLFTVIERGAGEVSARVIASLAGCMAASRNRDAVLAAMIEPSIRIVSLTVTEKAYGIQRATGKIDKTHPSVTHDLANPRQPSGVLGLLAEALRLRRGAGIEPFTVLCCDNLPENGKLLQSGVVDFAGHTDSDLGRWIASNVAFPSTMVDRITPAVTSRTHVDASRLTGCDDLAAVETEPFRQWVIEDHFPTGRPAWEAGGAIFVKDVAPYEHMKLRMLNGAHSMLAYSGFLSGCTFVRDVMQNHDLSTLVRRHLQAAAGTLEPLEAIDTSVYADDLIARFENPNIAHETYQIAMDGTEKLPQRILYPVLEALERGQDIRPFAFAAAAWMRYCLGRMDDGTEYALKDPRSDEIAAALTSSGDDSRQILASLRGLPGLFPPALTNNDDWVSNIIDALSQMLECGMAQAIQKEAGI